MPHRKHHKQHRKPTPAESYLCLILVGVLIFLSTALGAPIQFGIVLATAAAFLMSMRLGFTWQELEEVVCDRIGKLSSTMLIMWSTTALPSSAPSGSISARFWSVCSCPP